MLVTILSLNTWSTYGPYEHRWPCMISQLKTLKPDVLLLQEVTDSRLLDQIKKATPLLHCAHQVQAGLATVTRFPLIATENVTYQSKSPLENEIRGALVNTVQIGGKMILLANTHLAWRAEDGGTRAQQVRELLKYVQTKGLPAILAGDFNDVPESPAVEWITRNAEFCDLFEHSRSSDRGITWDNRNPYIQTHAAKGVRFPDRRIDYLFASRNLAAARALKRCEVVFRSSCRNGAFASDHYGVLAEMCVEKYRTPSAGRGWHSTRKVR